MAGTRQAPPSSARTRGGDAAWDGPAAAARTLGRRVARGWRVVVRWLRAATFSPPWLPARWRHPLTGYVVAVLVEGLASLLTLLLVLAYHGFPFSSVFALLGVALVALTFGAGPSLLATGIGAVLLDGVDVPANSTWPLASVQNAVAGALVLGAGAVVSVMASAVQRAGQVAEAATRDRDTFLGLAAHELNTPVMLIQGSAQLLGRRLARPAGAVEPAADGPDRRIAEARPVVARIASAAERMGRLIAEMLAFAAIRAGRLEYHLASCDLAPIVTLAVGEQRLLHADRRILLEVPDTPVTVLADADRIAQVVAQYVRNALKYAPEGRPVTVRLEVRGDRAQVSVRDEGPGLPPEEQDRVWEAFYRAPGVAVQGGSDIGLGLGLYLCRTIVERHGGETGVESAVGHGSTFWFALSLAPAAVSARQGA
jgi:signal transduction histidine kinase